jgi:type II secretory pathway component PulJ
MTPRRHEADRSRPGCAGLTLLEALLALALTVLLVSTTAGIVAQTATVRGGLERRATALDAARSALWILRDDLAVHRPGTLRVERTPAGDPEISFERDEPEPIRVAYRVERGLLLRQTRHRLHVAAHPRRTTVTDAVRLLDVAMLGSDGWTETWTAAAPPRAVTLTLDRMGAPRLTVTVVPLLGGSA